MIKIYKFGQIEIASKEFNNAYQIAKDVDVKKIRISEGVVANKNDTRYTIGYEVEPGKILPFYIKTLFQNFFALFHSYDICCLFRFGANFFFHFSVMFDI